MHDIAPRSAVVHGDVLEHSASINAAKDFFTAPRKSSASIFGQAIDKCQRYVHCHHPI